MRIVEYRKAKANFDLGVFYFKNDDFENALTAFQTAIELNPGNPLFWQELGLSYFRTGNTEEALKACAKAVELDPHCYCVYLKLAKIYAAEGNFIKSIKAYEKAIYLGFDSGWIYNELGDCLSKIGNITMAKSCYQTALEKELNRHVANSWELNGGGEPKFLIIGYSQCGAQHLYNYLIQHPQILPAAKKDVRFFTENYHYGIDWYEAHFPVIPKEKNYITGEVSVNYVEHPAVIERIYKNFPNIKMIILLRNPVERAYFKYQLWKKANSSALPFEEAIAKELERAEGGANAVFGETNEINFLAKNFYLQNLKSWMSKFQRKQFLVLQSAELFSNPENVVNNVFHFLELPEQKIQKQPTEQTFERFQPGSKALQKTLKDYFQPQNQLLEEFLRMELNW